MLVLFSYLFDAEQMQQAVREDLLKVYDKQVGVGAGRGVGREADKGGGSRLAVCTGHHPQLACN